MTRDEAVARLEAMVTSLDPGATVDAAVERLLERVSVRVDALELRAALVELGARALLEEAGRP